MPVPGASTTSALLVGIASFSGWCAWHNTCSKDGLKATGTIGPLLKEAQVAAETSGQTARLHDVAARITLHVPQSSEGVFDSKAGSHAWDSTEFSKRSSDRRVQLSIADVASKLSFDMVSSGTVKSSLLPVSGIAATCLLAVTEPHTIVIPEISRHDLSYTTEKVDEFKAVLLDGLMDPLTIPGVEDLLARSAAAQDPDLKIVDEVDSVPDTEEESSSFTFFAKAIGIGVLIDVVGIMIIVWGSRRFRSRTRTETTTETTHSCTAATSASGAAAVEVLNTPESTKESSSETNTLAEDMSHACGTTEIVPCEVKETESDHGAAEEQEPADSSDTIVLQSGPVHVPEVHEAVQDEVVEAKAEEREAQPEVADQRHSSHPEDTEIAESGSQSAPQVQEDSSMQPEDFSEEKVTEECSEAVQSDETTTAGTDSNSTNVRSCGEEAEDGSRAEDCQEPCPAPVCSEDALKAHIDSIASAQHEKQQQIEEATAAFSTRDGLQSHINAMLQERKQRVKQQDQNALQMRMEKALGEAQTREQQRRLGASPTPSLECIPSASPTQSLSDFDFSLHANRILSAAKERDTLEQSSTYFPQASPSKSISQAEVFEHANLVLSAAKDRSNLPAMKAEVPKPSSAKAVTIDDFAQHASLVLSAAKERNVPKASPVSISQPDAQRDNAIVPCKLNFTDGDEPAAAEESSKGEADSVPPKQHYNESILAKEDDVAKTEDAPVFDVREIPSPTRNRSRAAKKIPVVIADEAQTVVAEPAESVKAEDAEPLAADKSEELAEAVAAAAEANAELAAAMAMMKDSQPAGRKEKLASSLPSEEMSGHQVEAAQPKERPKRDLSAFSPGGALCRLLASSATPTRGMAGRVPARSPKVPSAAKPSPQTDSKAVPSPEVAVYQSAFKFQ